MFALRVEVALSDMGEPGASGGAECASVVDGQSTVLATRDLPISPFLDQSLATCM